MTARPEEITFVCRHLRPQSAEEMFMMLPTDDPDVLARLMASEGNVSWVAYHEDLPAAILGARPTHPGVWSLYGFGTVFYKDVLGAVTRHARRVMFPVIRGTGAHRAQAISPATHTDTHRWLQMLGGQEEAILKGFGKNGEDVKVFAWFEETA